MNNIPQIKIAQAALIEAGHPEWINQLIEEPEKVWGISIMAPITRDVHCGLVIKAVYLAHLAAGHICQINCYHRDHSNFSCRDCNIEPCSDPHNLLPEDKDPYRFRNRNIA